MELAIDTSTETASIAISSQGKLIAELTWHAGQNHTTDIMANVIHVLHQARVDVEDLDGLVVAKGPGSFNGLRVGMSVAKGLAFALGIPLVGISTLEVEAFPYANTALPICPIMSTGRGEIAAALFQARGGKWSRILEEGIIAPESLLAEVKGRTIFCGSIPREVALQLTESLGKRALIVAGAAWMRRAGYLAELGWRRLEQGDFVHSPTLQPLYLRKPSITTSRRVQPRPRASSDAASAP